MGEKAKKVMWYFGPRLIYRNPILALHPMFDGRKKPVLGGFMRLPLDTLKLLFSKTDISVTATQVEARYVNSGKSSEPRRARLHMRNMPSLYEKDFMTAYFCTRDIAMKQKMTIAEAAWSGHSVWDHIKRKKM